jgi:two-component system, NarL family, response regulator NreC
MPTTTLQPITVLYDARVANADGESEAEKSSVLLQTDVMIIGAFDMIREGLAALINRQEDLNVVAHARDAGLAKEMEAAADVVVVDVDSADEESAAVLVETRREFPSGRLLALSTGMHPVMVGHALAVGAAGYIPKSAECAELFNGIRAVAKGGSYIERSLIVDFERWNWQILPGLSGITDKERSVLYLLALGNTNVEIARFDKVSLRTVEAHRSRIYQKLGLRTRAELVQYAREVGLVRSFVHEKEVHFGAALPQNRT